MNSGSFVLAHDILGRLHSAQIHLFPLFLASLKTFLASQYSFLSRMTSWALWRCLPRSLNRMVAKSHRVQTWFWWANSTWICKQPSFFAMCGQWGHLMLLASFACGLLPNRWWTSLTWMLSCCVLLAMKLQEEQMPWSGFSPKSFKASSRV